MSTHAFRAVAAAAVLTASTVLAAPPALAADPVLQDHPLPDLRPKAAVLDLATPGTDQTWIVGYEAVKSGYPGNPVVRRWNGSRWAGYALPGFSSRGTLGSVSASAAGDVWVGGNKNGTAYVARWNGSAWTQIPAPAGLSNAAPEATTSGVWLPGNRVEYPGASTIWHREGNAWTPYPLPMKRVQALKSPAFAPGEAWAVGNSLPEDDFVPGVAHWTGATWENVPFPAPFSEGSVLEDVLPRTATDIWVVGTDYTRGEPRPTEPLIKRWNGTAWSDVALPADIISLASITQDGTGTIWASGLALSSAPDSVQRSVLLGRTLTSTTWSVIPTPAHGEFPVHHEGRDQLSIEQAGSRLWLLTDHYPTGPALAKASLLP